MVRKRLIWLGPSSECGNVHWAVARSSNALFTGREDILDGLETTIRASVQPSSPIIQCRMVISGIGGQGKSEICLQLAQRVRSLSDKISSGSYESVHLLTLKQTLGRFLGRLQYHIL